MLTKSLKLIFIFTIIILLIAAVFIKLKGYLQQDLNDESNELEEIIAEETEEKIGEYFSLDNGGVIIAKFKDAEITLIDQNDNEHFKSTEDVLNENEFDAILNAGYFQPDYSHAGLLIHEGMIKSQIAPLDKQLTHVLQLDPNFVVYSSEEFFAMDDSAVNGRNYIQAGPLLLEDGKYIEQYVLNSVNGNGLHSRSLFGFDSLGNIYLIYTTKQYDLKTLADLLQASDMVKDINITVINLDGGTSVSAFTNHSTIFNYQKLKKLPYYIGVTAE